MSASNQEQRDGGGEIGADHASGCFTEDHTPAASGSQAMEFTAQDGDGVAVDELWTNRDTTGHWKALKALFCDQERKWDGLARGDRHEAIKRLLQEKGGAIYKLSLEVTKHIDAVEEGLRKLRKMQKRYHIIADGLSQDTMEEHVKAEIMRSLVEHSGEVMMRGLFEATGTGVADDIASGREWAGEDDEGQTEYGEDDIFDMTEGYETFLDAKAAVEQRGGDR